MEKVFLTIGTNNIRTELMRKISDVTLSDHNAKPNGGLWLSDFHCGVQNINSWMDNITSFDKIESLYNTKYNGSNVLSGALVTLKDDAKIFVLNGIKDLEELIHKYPHSEGLFSYEELSKDYDGIYINYLSMPYPYLSSFLSFDVSSLILFNTKPIDYYQEAKIEVFNVERCLGDIILPSDYSIDISDEKKYIHTVSNEYIRLINELSKLMYKHWKEHKETYNNDKRNLFLYVYDYIANNCYEELKRINGNEENVNGLCYAMAYNVLPKK